MDNISQMQFTTIMKNENYIVRDHRVHEVRIMPGVTFLDMIYRLLKSKGFNLQEIELRNILFQEPVATTDLYDKKIQITFNKVSDYWTVQGRSQKIKDDIPLTEKWDENLQCELHLNMKKLEKRISIDALKKNSSRIEDMDYAYGFVRKMNINHREFMKGLGQLYFGEGYILAEMHLGELASQYMNYFYMHPAYLDAATLAVGLVVFKAMDFSGEVKPSIPIFIDSFRSNDRMNDKIYVYIKDEEINFSTPQDVMYFDIEIYNEEGGIITDFKKWGLKKIRSKDLISKLEVIDTPEEEKNSSAKANTAISEESDVKERAVSSEDSEKSLKKAIENDVRKMVANMKKLNESQVRLESGFYDQGLDSTDLLSLVSELEKKLGQQLYPTLLFEYTNIKDLAEYLMENYKDTYPVTVEENKPESTALVKEASAKEKTGVVYYKTSWHEQPVKTSEVHSENVLVFDTNDELFNTLKPECSSILVRRGKSFKKIGQDVFEINPKIYEDYILLFENLSKQNITPQRIIHNYSDGIFVTHRDELEGQLDNSIYSIFYIGKALMSLKLKNKVKLLYVYSAGNGTGYEGCSLQPHYAAVGGFLKCLNTENPKILYKTAGIANGDSLAGLLLDEFETSWEKEAEVCYIGAKRLVKYMEDIPQVNDSDVSIKEKGVYLITGGMGGLGLMFVQHMVDKKARVVLTGRSELNEDKKSELDRLNRLGAQVIYIKSDISKKEDAKSLAAKIKNTYGALEGIVHCAGIIKDSYVVTKTKKEMDDVLSAKLYGTLHLNEAFKEEKLDFFVMFSSTAGILGSPGQSDYAYGNSFMDNFAHLREHLRGNGMYSGKTLSINWPLWEEGGMKSNEQVKELLKSKFGIVPLSTEAGIKAFENALALTDSQVMALEGYEDRLRQLFEARPVKTEKLSTCNRAEAQVQHEEKMNCQDVAIIGVSGRYPMADNLDEYWENLKNGKDCVSEAPQDRWDYKVYEEIAAANGRRFSKWGGFMNDVDKFDPLLFNISPRDAETMDPHERLFLETVWETLEDAGYTKSRLKNEKVGVFSGVMWLQYQFFNSEKTLATTTVSSVANRVSYYFSFKGPSIGLDTMCSSSITSIHLACQSIRSGECELAVAGGTNLSVHPNKYMLLAQGNFTSSDGRCKSFGEGGDGYVPGEGVGAILLKPLSKAVKDGDRIYAVIKGSSINHGGEANGFTVPNPQAQAGVISDALKRSGVNPRTISFIEAHGTGTSLGDPIEITGLSKAFREYTRDKGFCSIGSSKSNIGHLESAAGIAAITKVLLQMKYKKLVPSIHSGKLNPNIKFEESPFYVQRELSTWERPIINQDGESKTYPRRAGISAFGAGGSNAHIILEEYENPQPAAVRSNEKQVVVLSAKNEERLNVYAKRVLDFLKKSAPSGTGIETAVLKDIVGMVSGILKVEPCDINSEESIEEHGFDNMALVALAEGLNKYNVELDARTISEFGSIHSLANYIAKKDSQCETGVEFEPGQGITLANMAYTLQIGREPMDARLAVVVSSLNELKDELEKFCQGSTASDKLYSCILKANKDNGEGLEEDVKDGIANKDMHKLAKLWTSGAEVKWKALYSDLAPTIVSLPHYPFARRRYWMTGSAEKTVSAAPQKASAAQSVSLKDHLNEPAVVAKSTQTVKYDNLKPYTGDEVKLEIMDNIALVTLQDKKNRNSFSENFVEGIMAKFAQIQKNKDIKAIVVTGYESIFCMGGTQEQLISISNRTSSFTDAPFLYKGFLECDIPVISAMQGHASGGGMLFGLYADIVVMAEEGVYSAVFTKYGFTPGMGATFILKEKLGPNLATEMMFTAKSFRGEEIKSRGASIIFRKKDEVLREALAIAKMMAEKPRLTLSILKQELSSRILSQLDEVIRIEDEMHEKTFTTPEVKQRIQHYYRNSGEQESIVHEGGLYERAAQGTAEKQTEAVTSGKAPKIALKPKGEQPAAKQEIKPGSIRLESTKLKTGKPESVKPQADRPQSVKFQKSQAPQTGKQAPNEESVLTKIINIVSVVLYIPESDIDIELSFKDYGVDSISGVEIIRDINKTFNLNVDAIAMYDYSNISLLTRHVISQLGAGQTFCEEPEEPKEKDGELLELLSRLNNDDLDIDQVAQYLEEIYE